MPARKRLTDAELTERKRERLRLWRERKAVDKRVLEQAVTDPTTPDTEAVEARIALDLLAEVLESKREEKRAASRGSMRKARERRVLVEKALLEQLNHPTMPPK